MLNNSTQLNNERKATMTDKTIYLIYAGTGRDGGFGDYSGADWSSAPIQLDGETVWFENPAEAEALVQKLNVASSDTFSTEAKHEVYFGMFPLEYEVRKIIIPSNESFTADNFQKIFESQQERWSDPELDSDDDYAELETQRGA